MAFVEWNDKLSVGNENIDKQHKNLIAIINDLHTAMKKGEGKTVLENIIERLSAYTLEHFTDEEEFLASKNYTDLDAHKDIHKNFIAKVNEFQDGVVSGKILVSIKIMQFLKDWLLEHIAKTDQKYANFIK